MMTWEGMGVGKAFVTTGAGAGVGGATGAGFARGGCDGALPSRDPERRGTGRHRVATGAALAMGAWHGRHRRAGRVEA